MKNISADTTNMATNSTTVSARVAAADGGADRPRQWHVSLTKARTGTAVWDGTIYYQDPAGQEQRIYVMRMSSSLWSCLAGTF